MKWYINHLSWPDKWGLCGTTYNYNVNSGVETSTDDAVSTDSYAGGSLPKKWVERTFTSPARRERVRLYTDRPSCASLFRTCGSPKSRMGHV